MCNEMGSIFLNMCRLNTVDSDKIVDNNVFKLPSLG